MITMNYQFFEIISQEIEYLNELTMSFVDLVLLHSLCQFEQDTSVIMGCVVSLIATLQLAVYWNGQERRQGYDRRGASTLSRVQLQKYEQPDCLLVLPG